MTQPTLITSAELARLHGVTSQTIRQWVQRGKIKPAAKIGKMLVFHPDTQRPDKRNPGRPKKTQETKAR